MARWLNDLAEAIPFERRQSPSGPGVGTGGFGVVALLVGAGLMYFFDPEAGPRRRAAAQAALTDLARRMGGVLDDASRDVVSRARELGVVRRPMTSESQSL
jgi:hypothetical protein